VAKTAPPMATTTTASQLARLAELPATWGVISEDGSVSCIDASDTAAKTPDSPAGNVDPIGEGEAKEVGDDFCVGVGDGFEVGVGVGDGFGVGVRVGVGVGVGVEVGVGVGVGEGAGFTDPLVHVRFPSQVALSSGIRPALLSKAGADTTPPEPYTT